MPSAAYCQGFAGEPHSERIRRRTSWHRRAQSSLRCDPGAPSCVGAPLRIPPPDAFTRWAASVFRRRSGSVLARCSGTSPRGLAAAEAAALAGRSADDRVAPSPRLPAAARDELAAALDAFDEPGAQSTLDRLLSEATVETVLTDVILRI